MEGMAVPMLAVLAALAVAVVALLRGGGGAGIPSLKGPLEQISSQLQNQERGLNETLRKQGEATGQRLGDLQARLAVIDKAQDSLKTLSEQAARLENVLSNKQARGAYGEMQLENLVRQMLPPNAYRFQHQLSNGSRPDCLLDLPNPPGPIVIDAKFPLEAWYEIGDAKDEDSRKQARRKLADAFKTHVKAIADKYLITGETAESAILFLPSEAVYAEFHTHLRKSLEESFKHRVYPVSPTTLMATLNTVRAILRDVQMREQAAAIQAEVSKMVDDIHRLNERVASMDKHFDRMQVDVEKIKVSTIKISSRGEKIYAIEVEDESEPPAVVSKP